MSPDDIHQLVQAVIQILYAAIGYFASHYGNKQGAALAGTAPETPKP